MSVDTSSDTEKVLWEEKRSVMLFLWTEISARHPFPWSGVFSASRAVCRLPVGQVQSQSPIGARLGKSRRQSRKSEWRGERLTGSSESHCNSQSQGTFCRTHTMKIWHVRSQQAQTSSQACAAQSQWLSFQLLWPHMVWKFHLTQIWQRFKGIILLPPNWHRQSERF